jgi:chorismate--pyruvate lyase
VSSQISIGSIKEGWYRAERWPEAQRPECWSWLTHRGSLTQKLRGVSGAAFHVHVLNETATRLDAEDARLLAAEPGSRARLREVFLCGESPMVYGRTLAAADDAVALLNALGAQPLGDRVFGAPDTERGHIEIKCVGKNDELYLAATQTLVDAPAALWARRSVLQAQGVPLLIYECFLPGVSG